MSSKETQLQQGLEVSSKIMKVDSCLLSGSVGWSNIIHAEFMSWWARLHVLSCVGTKGAGIFSTFLINWKPLDSSTRQTHYIIYMVMRLLCWVSCCSLTDRCIYPTSIANVILVRALVCEAGC